jgi:hypothetical protein
MQQKILAIVLIIIALVNLAGSLSIFQPTGVNPVPLESADETLPQVNAELAEDAGGLNSVTGLAVAVVSAVMLIAGVGLLLGRVWYMMALITLGLDMILKATNIIVQIIIQESLPGILPAIFFIVVEGVLFYLFYRQRTLSGVHVTDRKTAQGV